MVSRTNMTGFTLIELLVTVAIVAILVAVGFPAFEGSMRSNRVATSTNGLMASLALARSEAVRNPTGAALCTSTAGTACNGATWDDGWMVWIDLDGDGAPDAGERVVRYTQGNDRMAVTATATAGGTQLIQFDARGRVVGNRSLTITLQPDTCPSGQPLVRVLTVFLTGQLRVARGNCV